MEWLNIYGFAVFFYLLQMRSMLIAVISSVIFMLGRFLSRHWLLLAFGIVFFCGTYLRYIHKQHRNSVRQIENYIVKELLL